MLISHDIVGTQMAGPGIRYYHLARVLAKEFEVTLAVPHEKPVAFPGVMFPVVQYNRGEWASLMPLMDEGQIVVFPSDIAGEFLQLAQQDLFLVIDGYDPLLAEWLPLHQSLSLPEQQRHWQARMCDLTRQYLVGDFFLCASERQRDWWLGLLEANGRINPYTFQEDFSLRRLIDVVPFGLPETTAQHTRSVIKEVWPGIKETDRVILWGGGLWPWLDPLTAIRAVAKVWEQRQDVRLIFPGTRHPNPSMSETPTHNRAASQIAREIGLLDKAIFFGDWIPYADWANVLLESDLALTLHYDTLETRLAFRSRMLEYIWGELPIVATTGDATSELVAEYGLGVVVDYEDVNEVAAAILRLLEIPRDALSEQFSRARQSLTWEQVAQPLVEFCRYPRRSPDKVVAKNNTLPESNIGSPFYLREIRPLQALVEGYEQGRFIRLMRLLHRLKKRVSSRRSAHKRRE